MDAGEFLGMVAVIVLLAICLRFTLREHRRRIVALEAQVKILNSGAVAEGAIAVCGCGHLRSMHCAVGCMVKLGSNHCKCMRSGDYEETVDQKAAMQRAALATQFTDMLHDLHRR